MIKQVLRITLVVLSVALIGCGKQSDEQLKTTKGFYSVTPAEPQIGLSGGSIDIEFVAMASWSVASSDSWCTVTSETKGEAGAGKITVQAPKNDAERITQLKITVDGYYPATLCDLKQCAVQTQGGKSVTYWIADIMSRNYLWNNNFDNIRSMLDYNSSYSDFLQSALTRTRGNDEDGYDLNGTRVYYSNCSRYTNPSSLSPLRGAATRAESLQSNYGFNYVMAVALSASTYGFVVGSVYPGSPADKAGIVRGTYITRINGTTITETNIYSRFYELLAYGEYYTGATLSIQTAALEPNESGNYALVQKDLITVAPASYDANPIIFSDKFTVNNSDRVIGYMVYSEFDLSHDEELIELFANFKKEGVNELILDLRYNPGGYVYSSTVLATMIAGESYKGKVYSHMVYNDDRTAKGEVGYFYIGQNPSMVDYPLIEKSLNSSLSLKRLYVLTTDNTASASELVINGLRGLDFEVYTVGTTSQGKNTGMEVEMSTSADYTNYEFGNYIYEFAPITFYNRNAKGFGDYHSGFTPAMEINESNYVIFDWKNCANNDLLMSAAAYHIINGSWPTLSSMPQRKGVERIAPAGNIKLRLPDGGCKVFAESAE